MKPTLLLGHRGAFSVAIGVSLLVGCGKPGSDRVPVGGSAPAAQTILVPITPQEPATSSNQDERAVPLIPEARLAAAPFPESRLVQLLKGPDDLDQRREAAIAVCMKSRGFAYTTRQAGADTSEFALAQMTGFNIGTSLGRVRPAGVPGDGEAPYLADLNRLTETARQSYLKALGSEGEADGTSTGCRGDAIESVKSQILNADPAAIEMLGKAYERITASAAYQTALTAFGACMSKIGVNAAGHNDAQQEAERVWAKTADNQEALRREVQIAVQNVMCRRSTTEAEIRAQEGPALAEFVRSFPSYAAQVSVLR